MRDSEDNTTTTDFQTTQRTHHPPIRENYFVEAEKHLSVAVRLIEEGRSDSATGAMKTCVLILDLLTSIRIPLRRLGNISSEAAMSPAPMPATVQPMAGAV